MALFRRRNGEPLDADIDVEVADDLDAQDGDQGEVSDGVTTGNAVDRSAGPFDIDELPHDGVTRLDLGALLVPGVEGMELRLDVDEASQQIVSVTVVLGDSALQVSAFAAPRSEGIWSDVREELATSLSRSGGTLERVTGSFGDELVAAVPAQDPSGRNFLQPLRFVGVDGPRWFLRGLISGPAARDAALAEPLELILRSIVVVRGEAPMAPGDLLPLAMPSDAVPAADVAGRPGLGAPERGPEITETR